MSAFRIALLPLDDRPCNVDHVIQLAAVAGAETLMPPHDLLRSHRPEHAFDDVHTWLEENLPRCQAAVLSLDFYLYGGLIRSRKMEIDEAEALRRLAKLDSLLVRHPGIRVYLAHVLLRLSVTLDANQSEDDWRNVFRYSVLAHQAELDPKLASERDEVQGRIPPRLLAEYLAVRERNQHLNVAVLKMEARPAYLIYGQEDCAEFGLHRREKRMLAQAVSQSDRGRQDSTVILTGADELTSMLVMRAVMDHLGVPAGQLPIGIRPFDPESLNRISSYEDIPVIENLDLHLAPSPFSRSAKGDFSARVHVLTFGAQGQKDLCFMLPEEIGKEPTGATKDFLAGIQATDAFLDLSHANGADPAVMREIARHVRLTDLAAFAAWNTTGNRLGTLIAHLGIRTAAALKGKLDLHADREYLRVQLLDNYIYSAIVRPRLGEECRKRGLNPWALGEAHAEISELTRLWMSEAASMAGAFGPFNASLPWPRIFEVKIN